VPPVTAWARTAADELLGAFARASAWWIVAAVLLHVSGQLCRGVAWREVLCASWPQVTRRRTCAWHLCGSGLSGVLSPRGGDAVRMALARRELPGASWPALTGTLVAEASFETLCGLLVTVIAVAIGVSMVAPPSVTALAVVAACAATAGVMTWRCARVRRAVAELGRGAAVLRDPRRFVTRVVPWQVAGRVLRMAAVWAFLHAAGLPSGPAVVVAAVAVGGSGSAIPIPGAGIAAAAAGLLIALPIAAGQPLDPAAVATLAVLQPVTLTAVGVTLSLGLLAALLEVRSPRALLGAARGLALRPSRAAALAAPAALRARPGTAP
jgi:uncharacterized membrane protein YbhN (UPF0104 family)